MKLAVRPGVPGRPCSVYVLDAKSAGMVNIR